MGRKSKIQWVAGDDGSEGATWNPIRARNIETGKVGWHCEHVHEGCRHCYAEAMNLWIGTGLEFKPGNLDKVELFLDEKILLEPLKWKKPGKVFVCSMTDLFGRFVTDEWRDRMFAVMALCPHLTFIVLTKRPEAMREYLAAPGVVRRIYELACDLAVEREPGVVLIAPGVDETRAPAGPRVHLDRWPLPNVWGGTSCSTQEDADKMVPEILATPLAKRIVSLEPLLEPIALHRLTVKGCDRIDALNGVIENHPRGTLEIVRLDQVIAGGESGRDGRPNHVRWHRSLRDQCRAAGVAFFEKQLGARPMIARAELAAGSTAIECKHGFDVCPTCDAGDVRLELKDNKGGDPSEWPEDLRVREFPR